MSLLRTNCPTCTAPQTLEPENVILHVGDDGKGRDVFECDSCHVLLSRGLANGSLETLVSAGATLLQIHDREGSLPPPPPALTLDDLLELHQLLNTNSWFDAVQQCTAGTTDARDTRRALGGLTDQGGPA